MTETQKEICNELIAHANTKKEVVTTMKTLYEIDNKTLLIYINKEWEKRIVKGNVSFRELSYKEKKAALDTLLTNQEKGRIKHIYFRINKCLSKETNTEMYAALLGSKLNWDGREKARGERVELIGFHADQIALGIKRHTEETFYFTIFDINCTYYIETE